MPVHDAMYTFAKAESLKAYANKYTDQALIAELDAVMNEALAASSANASAVVHFFNVLDVAMQSENKELREKALSIFHGPYNAEVA